MKQPIRRIAVYCAANEGISPLYAEIATRVGRLLASNNCGIIYGGGSVGLMGFISRAALSEKAEVIGIIPKFLKADEEADYGISELITVETMHERKTQMAELADAFLVLPGGFGTLDEMIEIITWNQLNLINKPVCLLNACGYYDHLLKHFKHAESEGFLRKDERELFKVTDDPEEAVRYLSQRKAEDPDALEKA